MTTMDSRSLVALADRAARQGWRIVGLTVNELREGYVLNGIAAIDRDRSPIAPDRTYGSLRWAVREDGTASFESGEYDLTRDEALLRLTARMDEPPKVPA